VNASSCPQSPSELGEYLDSEGVTFVLLSRPNNEGACDYHDWVNELGPDVAIVTDRLLMSAFGAPECEDAERRQRAQEIDKVIQESVRRLKLRDDLSFTVFWYVEGGDKVHMEQHPEGGWSEGMDEVLDFVNHHLRMVLL
jgi:hypothetical protein